MTFELLDTEESSDENNCPEMKVCVVLTSFPHPFHIQSWVACREGEIWSLVVISAGSPPGVVPDNILRPFLVLSIQGAEAGVFVVEWQT